MSTQTTQRRGGLRPVVSWAAAAALSAGFLFGNSAALAAAPPANTVIGNQASAAYLDPNGLAQTATSNLVQTTVQAVGSFNLDGDTATVGLGTIINSKTGAAGATLYAPHVLTNTGNASDSFSIEVVTDASTFSSVAIYADANGDGLPDTNTPICVASAIGCTTTAAQAVAGNNGQFQFVVAYSMPSSVDNTVAPWDDINFGTVTATATNIATYVGATEIAVRDQVTYTLVAAFNMTKAIMQPAAGVLAPGNLSWPLAPVTGQRSVSDACVLTVAGARTPAPGCQYTVYTLTFSNTGGADGRFAFSDTLQDGFTYVPNSAVWSGASGVALETLPTGITAFGVASQVISGTVTSLPRNVTQTISFIVRVDADATVGTGNTTNHAIFSETGTVLVAGGLNGETNKSAFTVTATNDVVLGAGIVGTTATNALDANPGEPNTSVNDTNTVGSAAAGAAQSFSVVVFNTGNAGDAVNFDPIPASPGGLVSGVNSFPAGTTFSYFKADGSTPLSDTNGDGKVDTGNIPEGASATIVVKANLPANLAPTAAGQAYTVIVTGTSVGDSTQVESTRLVLDRITGVLVDLTNTANSTGNDVGTGPSTSPTTTKRDVQVGTTTTFTLFVTNNDVVARTYDLLAGSTPSMGAMPAGWTVTFGSDAACTSTFTTLTVAAGVVDAPYFACVSVPASQPAPFTQPVYFQVRSAAFVDITLTPNVAYALAVDTKYDAVDVVSAVTFGATLTPNNSGQVAPGGSVVYAHTLVATGTNSCTGGYTVAVGGLPAGWTYALYIDENEDGLLDEPGDTLFNGSVANGTDLVPGVANAHYLLLKVFAPGGASAGDNTTATVTVNFTTPVGCGTPGATDISTVITGQMRLVKHQALATACTTGAANTAILSLSASPIPAAKPGACIVYRVSATNEGAAPVSNLSIFDAAPAWTTLATAQPDDQCTSTGVLPVLTAGTPAGTTDVSCTSTNNTVQPGGTGVLTFMVQINNNP